jgi:hypothetical protein
VRTLGQALTAVDVDEARVLEQAVGMALAAGAGIEALLTLLTWKRQLPTEHVADPTL